MYFCKEFQQPEALSSGIKQAMQQGESNALADQNGLTQDLVIKEGVLTAQSVEKMGKEALQEALREALLDNRVTDVIKVLKNPKSQGAKVISVDNKSWLSVYEFALNTSNTALIKALVENQIPFSNNEAEYKRAWFAYHSQEYRQAINDWLASKPVGKPTVAIEMNGDYKSYYYKKKETDNNFEKQPFIDSKGQITFFLAKENKENWGKYTKWEHLRVPESLQTINPDPDFFNKKVTDACFNYLSRDGKKGTLFTNTKTGLALLEMFGESMDLQTFFDKYKAIVFELNCTENKIPWNQRINDIQQLGAIKVPAFICDKLKEAVPAFEALFNKKNNMTLTAPWTYGQLMGTDNELISAFCDELVQVLEQYDPERLTKAAKLIDNFKQLPPPRLAWVQYRGDFNEEGKAIKESASKGDLIKLTDKNLTENHALYLALDLHNQLAITYDKSLVYQMNKVIIQAYEQDDPSLLTWLTKMGLPMIPQQDKANMTYSSDANLSDFIYLGALLYAYKKAPKCFEFFKANQLIEPLIHADEHFVRKLAQFPVGELMHFVQTLNIDLTKLHDHVQRNVLHCWAANDEVKSGWHTLIKAFPTLISQQDKNGLTPVQVQLKYLNAKAGAAFEAMISQKELLVLEKQMKVSEKSLTKSNDKPANEAKKSNTKMML